MSDPQEVAEATLPEAPRLSVLIVTYNSADTIIPCLDSLKHEVEGRSAELIVVDNASQDETQELLQAYQSGRMKIDLILNHHNRGFAAGNNQAFEAAQGEILLILNPDTVIHEGAVWGLVEALDSDPAVGILAPQLRFPDGRIQRTCRRFPTHADVFYHVLALDRIFPGSSRFNGWKMGDFDHREAREVDQPAGAALLVRRSLFEELYGFDLNFPMFFNDVDLCYRAKSSGHKIWYQPQFVFDHLGGASVKQQKIKMTISSQVSFFRYFEKHFTRLHHQPLNFMVGLLLYVSLVPRILFMLIRGKGVHTQRETL